jgi:hypothetical protein
MAGGAPNIAALPAIARLGACESARGPDAGRHVKLLIQFAVKWLLSGAYSHADSATSARSGRSFGKFVVEFAPQESNVRKLAVLASNCTPDRLRRLSVDADERPPHVLRVTEADCLRDAFDRFGGRLYASSGHVGTEPFHHTRRRGAGLRPECAAELTPAHAGRLRQMLECQCFGDVIAGVADGGGNTIVLRCQIDGGSELRLAAMAAVVDDEVLCDALSDSETVVLLDQGQREIDSGRNARRSPYVSVPTVDAIRLDPDGWVVSLKASCISPVRRRSTPVQQPSRRECECARANARHAPGSDRSVDDTSACNSGKERIWSADDDERIDHRIIERCSGSSHAKAVRYGTRLGREYVDPIGRTSKLAICRLKRAGRTGEIKHRKPWGNVKADRAHGRMIGKFDLPVM